MTVRFLVCLVFVSLGSVAADDRVGTGDEAARNLDLKSASIVQLAERYQRFEDAPDELLLEIMRRGDRAAEKILQGMLNRQAAHRAEIEREIRKHKQNINVLTDYARRKTDETDDQVQKINLDIEKLNLQLRNLTLLTALRRVQHRADPVSVEIRLVKDTATWDEFYSDHPPSAGKSAAELLGDEIKALEKSERKLSAARVALSQINQPKDRKNWDAKSSEVQKVERRVHYQKKTVSMFRNWTEQERVLKEISLPAVVEAEIDRIPPLLAVFSSVDSESTEIRVQEHESSIRGRKTRWRFEVRDDRGKLLPVKSRSTPTAPEIRDAWYPRGRCLKTFLNFADYVDLPGIGEYTVTLLHHHNGDIANVENPTELDQRVLYRSAPFRLKIIPRQKRILQLLTNSRSRSAALIRKLPDTGNIGVFDGPYDKAAKYAVPPESVPGNLLQMGWQAVPELIRALEQGDLTTHQKGWIYALLYELTGERSMCPVESQRWAEVLPEFTFLPRLSSGHAFLYQAGTAEVDSLAQNKLSVAWRDFGSDCLEIREAIPSVKTAEKR